MRPLIAHVVPTANANPLLMAMLDNDLADYHVFALQAEGSLMSQARAVGVDVTPVLATPTSPAGLAAFRRELRSLKPDAVEFHAFGPSVLGYQLSHLMRHRPAFLSVRHHNLNHYLQKRPRAVLADRRISRGLDHHVAVSRGVRDTMLAEGAAWESVSVVPNALPFPAISHDHEGVGAGKGTRLLAVGRLDWQKDYPTLLRAISTIERSGMKFTLDIAGTGNAHEQDALASLIHTLGLHEAVSLLGFREDIPELMSRADLLVHTARDEACPLVIIEALQIGLPIVATSASGTRELLQGVYSMSEPGDVDGLARNLTAAVAGLEELHRRGHGLRDAARKAFDPSALGNGHLRACEIAMRQRRKPIR